MASRLLGAALLAPLLLAAPARAAPPVPGVTDTEVTIGITGPLSGPAAAWGSIALASEAYAKYVNEQGGVHGRKLKIVLKDDGYNPGRGVANFTEMKDQVFAVVGTVGSAVIAASKDVAADAGLPLIYPLGDPQIFARQPKEKLKRVFQVYPDYTDEGEFLVQQAAKLEGVKKVGVFGQNDDYGKGGLAGVKKGAAKAGVSVVGEVFYEVTDRELGTHAMKMKESGAEAVIFYANPVATANVLKEMAKIGYRPKVFASFTLYDRDTMFRLVGDLWAGAYFNTVLALRGEPAADKLIETVIRYEPKLKGREGFCTQGAADVLVIAEGLNRAGRNLTREGFVKAMETFKDYTENGLSPPITFGPDRHHGLNGVRMMRAGQTAADAPKQITGYQIFPSHF